MMSAPAGQRLPSPDDRIDIGGVKLQPVAAPASALGRDQCRTAAEKRIEHDVAAGRAIEDRIGDHRHRLHGRVQRQEIALLAAAGEGIGSGVVPTLLRLRPNWPSWTLLRCPWRPCLNTNTSSCWLR